MRLFLNLFFMRWPASPEYQTLTGFLSPLRNAVKFSKHDGVVELIVTPCDRVEPFGAPKADSKADANDGQERRPSSVKFARKVLRVSVKDFGKGIEKKNFDSIFQPFTQTNSGINNIDGGTGLGLAITEKLVRALGGDIKVDSCLGEWTEFTVDLPYEEPPANSFNMTTRFKQAEFFVVGPDEQLANIFNFFNVEKTEYASMKEFETSIESRPPTSEGIALVCMTRSDLSQTEIASRLGKEKGIKFVVIGPADSIGHNNKHYQSIGEIIPHVFMEEIATVVEETLQMRTHHHQRSQDQLTLNAPHAPCDLAKLRILCAEDNLVNQKILVRMLKRLNVAEIEVVENGQLAVDKEASSEFDIVLMDLQMPVMDGIDATKLILAREGGHRHPLVIFVTAHVSSTFEAQCIDCGATAYLPKPYSFPVLKETLLDAAGKL